MDPKLVAFLDLVAWSEGTSTSPITKDRGYDIIVSGIDGPHRMLDYDDHPFAPQYHRRPIQFRQTPPTFSTASGRYQILYRWWEPYKLKLGLSDFSPASQDAVAIQQMDERRAVDMVLAGNVQGAIEACSNIWASFPGNTYGQGSHSMATLLEHYA